MIGLIEEFEKLPIPSTTSKHSYSAVSIKGFENHRLAKDAQENPCLLISVSQTDGVFKVINQKLYNLLVTHNLACEILVGEKIEKQHFSVISYSGNDDELKSYFLNACEILMNSLGKSPDNEKIKRVVSKFIELFRVLNEPPRKTIQGLWAELFLIQQSSNPEELAKAWHIIPEEKYDFSMNKLRIEVKSSSVRSRVHHFSIEQLLPPSECELFVASVFVDIIAGGKTVADLLEDLIERLNGDSDLIEKLNFVTYSTLGSSIDRISSIGYDYELAKDSLKFYSSNTIPKIEHIPDNVTEVRFKSSLENIEPVKRSTIGLGL